MTPRYKVTYKAFIFLGQCGDYDLYYRNRVFCSLAVIIVNGEHPPAIYYFDDPVEILHPAIVEAAKRVYQMGLIR